MAVLVTPHVGRKGIGACGASVSTLASFSASEEVSQYLRSVQRLCNFELKDFTVMEKQSPFCLACNALAGFMFVITD